MAATETLVVEHDNMTLDLVLWRRFKRAYPGMVERTLDINPGLSAGIILPIGRTFTVELPAADAPNKAIPVITLWG